MGLNSGVHTCSAGALPLDHSAGTFFCGGYFQDMVSDKVSQTICLGWPQTMILLIIVRRVPTATCSSHLLFHQQRCEELLSRFPHSCLRCLVFPTCLFEGSFWNRPITLFLLILSAGLQHQYMVSSQTLFFLASPHIYRQ
jgi:hypothetical protein